MKIRIVALIALLTVALAAVGCVREPLPEGQGIHIGNGTGSSTGSAGHQTSQQTIDLSGATDAKVTLTMGAGEMKVRSGNTSALAEATFEYGDASWKPEVTYRVSGSTGALVVEQPDVRFRFGRDNANSWDVQLGKGIPTDLTVHVGAGTSDLDLRELGVRDLTMRLGAGETTLDLTGPRTADLDGAIQAGVGQLVIKLPTDVGVRVTGRNTGIGTFEADGFTVRGDAYVNQAYGTSPVTIDLDVMRGVGEVKLELQ